MADDYVYAATNGKIGREVSTSLGQKKKNLDLGFALHRAVLYRYQDPPKKNFSNL